jgi:nucleosome binding factor SPN SPT16 subunit
VQAKTKDPPSDALPRFLKVFTSSERVGTLTKEPCTGKLIDEWNKALSGSDKKPQIVDIAPSVSSFMAVKDDEELVSRFSSCAFMMLSCG